MPAVVEIPLPDSLVLHSKDLASLEQRSRYLLAARFFELGGLSSGQAAEMVYGLRCKGTAGLLVEAKSRGIIPAVKPCPMGMIQGGHFLGPALVAACLAAAGER